MPPSGTAPAGRPRVRPIDLWRRYLPPVRLVWIFLTAIGALQGAFASASQAGPILAIVFLGATTDLGFQRIRFARLRVPDAALATSLFVALIIWPASFDLALASIAVASVGLRHVARVASHPLFNPAAIGLALATVVFGMPTSWHVGLTPADAAVIVALGAVLVVRAPHTIRLVLGYFGVYLPLTAGLILALGGARELVPLFVAGALGPASVFFGMFMVSEPRTAPTARRMMWIYAGAVGLASAILPAAFNEVPVASALGVLAPFLALFVGNALTVLLPSARGGRSPVRAVESRVRGAPRALGGAGSG